MLVQREAHVAASTLRHFESTWSVCVYYSSKHVVLFFSLLHAKPKLNDQTSVLMFKPTQHFFKCHFFFFFFLHQQS